MVIIILLWVLVGIVYLLIYRNKDNLEDGSLSMTLGFFSGLFVLPLLLFTIMYIMYAYQSEFLNKIHETTYSWDEWFFNRDTILEIINQR